ncbi:MAG: methyltransferase domain-containing protein [Candidatus Saliniplasma sp.]
MNSSHIKDYKDDIKRVNRDRREAKKHYDKISWFYGYFEGIFEKKYRDMGIELLDLGIGESILEIGFGTGEALMKMGREVKSEGTVIGLDISTEMAAVSKAKLDRERDIKNVYLVCGDALNLPFKEDHFDKILFSFTLELFDTPEIKRVLTEIRRVLKSDGRLGIITLFKDDNIFVDIYEFLHDIFPKIIDCRPIVPERVLEDAGFKIEKSIEECIVVIPIKIVIGRLC